MKLKEALREKLTPDELTLLRSSFDVIGDIAIIEVPLDLKHKQKTIAKALLNLLNNINVVAVKQGGHKGKYRRQPLAVMAGENRLETIHKESGVRLKLNVETCYYSPRLGTERLRIAKQVKKGERILVAGSGIGPYPLVLAKNSNAGEITGVEFNPAAHKYAQENIILNKAQDRVTAVKGDVTSVTGLGKFNRIIAAMPHDGVSIVPALLKFAKPGARIHAYDFAPQEDMKEPSKQLKELCAKKNKPVRILRTVKAGQHAVRRYRVCVDAKLLNQTS